MSNPTTLRSVWAVIAGFLTVFILSSLGDVVIHASGYYPPEGVMPSTGMWILFLSYRFVFTVLGGYVTARLAPANPMKHVLILGSIGTVAGLIGVFAMGEYGPAWYAWALVVTAIPLTWLGGKLRK
jgi:hypothetical protein